MTALTEGSMRNKWPGGMAKYKKSLNKKEPENPLTSQNRKRQGNIEEILNGSLFIILCNGSLKYGVENKMEMKND